MKIVIALVFALIASGCETNLERSLRMAREAPPDLNTCFEVEGQSGYYCMRYFKGKK